MKIALCQFNPIIGAMTANAKRLIEFSREAQEKGAELIIAPELAICGYPPKDLLFHPEFKAQVQEALDFIADETPIPFILGAPIERANLVGQPFWNAAVLCQNKGWKIVSKKQLLPNYDVFDERRYFEPPTEANEVFEVGSVKIGLTICEEAWNDSTFFMTRRYAADPMSERAEQGADLLVNIAASPFALGKPAFREKMLAHTARRLQRPLLMCGQVGGIDQILFDGSSVGIGKDGTVLTRASAFVEDLLVFDTVMPAKLDASLDWHDNQAEWMRQALVCGISDYFKKCGAKGAVIGLSGGIDSAVVAVLATQALGAAKVIGVRMPSAFSSSHSLEDAEVLARNLGIELRTIAIEEQVQSLREALGKPSGITDQNLQARVRGVLLMAISNDKKGYLVLTTGNKSELSVGYCTLYGDMCGALAPLGDLYKTDVYELARHLNAGAKIIPERTITKVPSAELKPNQTDQDTLPPYEELDAILRTYMETPESLAEIRKKTGLSMLQIQDVVKMVHRSEYKRAQSPQILMLTDRVFGQGRRVPIAHRFDPSEKS